MTDREKELDRMRKANGEAWQRWIRLNSRQASDKKQDDPEEKPTHDEDGIPYL